ncbi:MAG: DUF4129 domain-containing protein [Acidimicrobiales bacterium]
MGDGEPGGPSAKGPVASGALGLMLVAAVAAIVLAASRGSAADGAVRVRPPNLGILALVGVAAIAVLGLAVLTSLIRTLERGELRSRHRRVVRDLVIVVGIVAVLLLFFALRRAGLIGDEPADQPPPGLDPSTEFEPTDPGSPWFSVAILASVAGVAAWFAYRNRSGPVPDDIGEGTSPLSGAVGELLDEVVDELRREHDARRAVIRAYARMEDVFADHGVPRRPSEAPLEFLARALEHVAAPEPTGRLTDLFERAMFSTQPFDRAQQDDAIEGLLAVRSDLGRSAGAYQ